MIAASANAASVGCVTGLSAEKPFLSVRSEPGGGGKVLYRLSNGDPVIVISITKDVNDDVDIIRTLVTGTDIEGYVLAEYIREAKSPEECADYRRTGE
ncbi:MAG: SH3 domain-containing protein [Alphaproteobacteria bacterium]|nr:SH3 domain-containing protein [Alphaproteobacteria bacterium]